MKTISSTALVALLTATIGLSAAAPALAQGAPGGGNPQMHHHQFGGPGRAPGGPGTGGAGMGHGGFGGGMFDFARGAEAVEIALVRLSHRVELTAEQQPLFDAFRDAAVTAATDLESTLADLRPAEQPDADAATTEAAPLDIAGRFADRIAFERARLDAMEAVEPSLTAFFDSLTNEQLVGLMPQGRDGNMRPHIRPPAPEAAPAPAAPPQG